MSLSGSGVRGTEMWDPLNQSRSVHLLCKNVPEMTVGRGRVGRQQPGEGHAPHCRTCRDSPSTCPHAGWEMHHGPHWSTRTPPLAEGTKGYAGTTMPSCRHSRCQHRDVSSEVVSRLGL